MYNITVIYQREMNIHKQTINTHLSVFKEKHTHTHL